MPLDGGRCPWFRCCCRCLLCLCCAINASLSRGASLLSPRGNGEKARLPLNKSHVEEDQIPMLTDEKSSDVNFCESSSCSLFIPIPTCFPTHHLTPQRIRPPSPPCIHHARDHGGPPAASATVSNYDNLWYRYPCLLPTTALHTNIL